MKGSPKAGWTQINFDNAGVENHMMVVFKLKKGTTPAQFKKALLSQDQSAFKKIAPRAATRVCSGMPALIGPGQKTTTLTNLSRRHLRHRVLRRPRPTGRRTRRTACSRSSRCRGSRTSKPPTDGVAEVTLSDTSITVPPGNAPKTLTVKVTNNGTTVHSFQLVKLNDGKTLADANTYFNALFNTGKADGDAPGVLVGGVSEVAPSGIGYVEWTLRAGTYGYVSTDGDAPNDDFSKGLQGTFTIS